MATFGFQILLSVAVLCIFRVEVDCKVEKYAFKFSENGKQVREEVDIDAENGTEVIKVPGHNGKEPMDVMNDFHAGLTARRLPSTQKCYVSKLDSTLPSPEKLKRDMELASQQGLSGETKKETTTKVLGLADRSVLPQRILDFCGSFPIYNVTEISLDTKNGLEGQRRYKRQQQFPTACSSKDVGVVQFCLDMFGDKIGQSILQQKMSCQFSASNCYYVISCTKDPNFGGYDCQSYGHVYKNYCCSFKC